MAVFTWRGNEEFEEIDRTDVLITQFRGPEQRREKSPQRRAFRLPFSQFEDVANEIRDFYKARGGPLEAFDWVHPDTGETIRVRFNNDTLERTRIYGVAHQFDIELIEVL
jgi:phage-related protein